MFKLQPWETIAIAITIVILVVALRLAVEAGHARNRQTIDDAATDRDLLGPVLKPEAHQPYSAIGKPGLTCVACGKRWPCNVALHPHADGEDCTQPADRYQEIGVAFNRQTRRGGW